MRYSKYLTTATVHAKAITLGYIYIYYICINRLSWFLATAFFNITVEGVFDMWPGQIWAVRKTETNMKAWLPFPSHHFVVSLVKCPRGRFFFYGDYVQNEVSRIPPHFHIRESCRLSNPWICGRVFCRRNVEVLIADQCLRRIEYLYLGSNFHYPYTSSHTKRNCENHVFQIRCYPRHPAIPP